MSSATLESSPSKSTPLNTITEFTLSTMLSTQFDIIVFNAFKGSIIISTIPSCASLIVCAVIGNSL